MLSAFTGPSPLPIFPTATPSLWMRGAAPLFPENAAIFTQAGHSPTVRAWSVEAVGRDASLNARVSRESRALLLRCFCPEEASQESQTGARAA